MSKKYFFLAVNTGLMHAGLPDSRCRDFYRARSGHGLHCAIVGNVVTPDGVGTNDVCTKISADSAWQRLADAISEQGAIAGIQLSSTWSGYRGITKFVPSSRDDQAAGYKTLASSLTKNDAIAAFDSLRRGTDFAVKAGFRHVQLHAAHGYLFSLLIDRRFSPHAEFAAKSIEAWAKELKSIQVETSLRFSMWTGHGMFDDDYGNKFIDEIAAFPVDYLDASVGFYNIDKRLIYPSTSQLLTERVAATLAIAERQPGTNVILSGMSSHAWNDQLPTNVHIGICRDLIANPDFLKERTNGCQTCMKCHYFSRGVSHLSCGQWEPEQIS
jgi:2,4-dienoyl-CoA reductase-like NADH-dependent reductase (Old Yellow Enzyme family)